MTRSKSESGMVSHAVVSPLRKCADWSTIRPAKNMLALLQCDVVIASEGEIGLIDGS